MKKLNTKTLKGNAIPPLLIIPFILISLLFLIIGLTEMNNTIKFLKTAESANGIVIDKRQSSGTRGTAYFLTIRYTTKDNETCVAETDMAYGGLFAPKIGQKVSIVYDPQKMSHIKLNSTTFIFLMPFLFTLMGGIFLPLTITTVVRTLNKK